MAAPASLFFAKLILPETEQSQTSSNNIQLEKSLVHYLKIKILTTS
jgi:pyrimidine nucleoside transport protein